MITINKAKNHIFLLIFELNTKYNGKNRIVVIWKQNANITNKKYNPIFAKK